jgi:hypothetical protein
MKTKIRILFTRRFWYEFRLRIEASIVAMLPIYFTIFMVAFALFAVYHARKVSDSISTWEQEREELISELTAYRVMAEWEKFEEERR